MNLAAFSSRAESAGSICRHEVRLGLKLHFCWAFMTFKSFLTTLQKRSDRSEDETSC